MVYKYGYETIIKRFDHPVRGSRWTPYSFNANGDWIIRTTTNRILLWELYETDEDAHDMVFLPANWTWVQ